MSHPRRLRWLALGSAATLAACATVPGANVPAGAPITQAEAQQFISLWNRPVAGSARVLIVCGD